MPAPEVEPPRIDTRTHLAAIVDSSDDAIVSKDLDGTVLTWNKGAERLYGYTEEEMIGRSVSVLVPDDRPDEVSGILAKLRAGGTVEPFETVQVRKDGSLVPVSLSVSPVFDSEGRIVAASAIARDISERRRAAEQLERFESILTATNDAFVGMDADGIVTDWNRAAQDLLGWAPDEVIGRRLSETIIPERYRAAHEQGLRRYLETGEGPVIGQRIELAALHRDGHEIPIELSVFVTMAGGMSDSSSAERGGRLGMGCFNAFLHDISEHKRLTAELERARDQALKASRLKSDFLATMSHEVRTPMNGVIGMAGLLLDTELDPEQREFAEIVRSSGDALLSIINDILDFSKIEAGKLDLEIVDVDLRTLVEEVADLLAPRAHAKGLELATLVRPEVPPAVRGDPGRLRQILLNLLSNAVKFTDAGEVVVRATASDLTDRDVAIHFQVADTGIGIHPADRDRLFDPFSQADSSTTRTHGGTGLGLAICRRLVELLGGELTLESELGRGSTFEFTVRLAHGDPVQVASPPTDLTGLRVLIVDDNATNRRILEQQVRSWKMASTSVDGAPTALERLRAAHESGTPYNLALIDMDMPGMDGIELSRTIRDDPTVVTLPVLLLTSSGVRGSGEAARQAGVAAYLTKPVHQSQLFETIMTVLGGEAVPASPVTHASLAKGRAGSRPAILVAEDNPANQKVAAAMLARIGYRADVVANGAEAVEAVRRISYGAVLMDCQMPEMDGYAATAAIRSSEGDEVRVPIIAMTAAAMEGDQERCLRAGMDDYLTKPVNLDVLASLLKRWVRVNDDTMSSATHDGATTDAFDADLVASLRALLATQPGGFLRLATRLVDDAETSLAAVRTALAVGDPATAVRVLHTMTGSAATVGAHRLAQVCRRAGEELGEGAQGLGSGTITALEVELRRAQAWVRDQTQE